MPLSSRLKSPKRPWCFEILILAPIFLSFSSFGQKLWIVRMGEFGSDNRYGGGQWRHGIVSGKSYGARQTQAYSSSPSLPPIPTHAARPSQSDSKPWSFNDPESKRRKRISKYKVYSVEGKVKSSVRKGLRWIKNQCSQIVRGRGY